MSNNNRDWIDKSPPAISKWAYGVLAVFAVATLGLSVFKGNLISIILSSTVIIILFFAVYGFSRVATTRHGFWEGFGRIMIISIFGLMLFLFATIVRYVATGEPAFMSVWFPPNVVVRPPEDFHGTP